MKFAEHLSAHITPEWRKQYINYEEMKSLLYMAVEGAPSQESVEQEYITRHYANFDEHFFLYCDKELKKINTFYSEKLAEATRKFATLQAELKAATSDVLHRRRRESTVKRPISARKLQELKFAFSEFYLSLILLQNYQTLNHTGFRKILKKHDKLFNNDLGTKWREEHVETSHICTNKDIDKLITDTETTFTNELEGGDRQKAMKRLRVPPLGEQQSPWTTFKVGLFSGSFIVLLIAVVLAATFHVGISDNLKIAFRLYRGPLLFIEFLFLIGINIYGWRSSGVNHVLIFELDPRNHLSEQHLMELAAILGVIWALSVLSFLFSASLSMPPYVNPLALTIIMILFLINPLKVFRHEARFWLLRITPSIGVVPNLFNRIGKSNALSVACQNQQAGGQTITKNHMFSDGVLLKGRVIGAPFFSVNFADFWLADQMNSFVNALLDLQFLTCFYYTNGNWLEAGDTAECMERNFFVRPIINCLPAWFRFAQCLRRYYDSKEAFPHLVNAGKYATTFFVVLFATMKSMYASEYIKESFNPFLTAWFISQMISSTYAYIWDIKMDWGLLSTMSQADNPFLREEIVYSSSHFYYFAIAEDFVLRFLWMPSFFLTDSKMISSDLMTSITAPLEVFRRFIWNFFRLENEHLNNCGKFRAVRDISVAPIESSDQVLILRMMDDPDGVLNRGKVKGGKIFKKEEKRPLLSDENILKTVTITQA